MSTTRLESCPARNLKSKPRGRFLRLELNLKFNLRVDRKKYNQINMPSSVICSSQRALLLDYCLFPFGRGFSKPLGAQTESWRPSIFCLPLAREILMHHRAWTSRLSTFKQPTGPGSQAERMAACSGPCVRES
jgi:hypothetical protein